MSDNGLAEQMNQISDAVCGYREGRFEQIMAEIAVLKESHHTLQGSENLLSQRIEIREAATNLLDALEAVNET